MTSGKTALAIDSTGVTISAAAKIAMAYVKNTGAVPVYVGVGRTLAALVAQVTAGTAFPLAPGDATTFPGLNVSANKIHIATEGAGTTTVNVGIVDIS